MLLVKAHLAPSTVHGTGLFASEFIAEGTVIWRFDARIDRKFTRRERDALPEPARTFVATYSYPEEIGSDLFYLDGDHARFMNHSATPNTCCVVDTVAIRDIQAGEELLCDYDEFYPGHSLFDRPEHE
ncbi:MAG TPA: SET domain-containing protein [Candidatus Sulfotelmatobacter sp.]|jgi:SET domain-containing protein|nr:SET domain-containing protein [Candidatus Sulfotelmatobacter sp.]